MFISTLEDLVYKYQFDSFDDSYVYVNYNFTYSTDNPTDTEAYDVDVQSITAGDSSTDLQFIIDPKVFDRIVDKIIDSEQNHRANSLDDDEEDDYYEQ